MHRPIALSIFFLIASLGSASALETPRVVRFTSPDSVEVSVGGGKLASLRPGEQLGRWTLMALIGNAVGHPGKLAVMEDFSTMNGELVFVDDAGVKLDLPKASEPTSPDPSKPLYFGHTIEEVMKSPTDLLGNDMLSRRGDPDYAQVASALPPIQKMQTYGFVGTEQTFDKVGFEYGGRTPDFDPAIYFDSVAASRDNRTVRTGLVGGYLPVIRFVYPEADNSWVEMLAFAPLRISNQNDRIQPVWYRVAHIDHGALKWVKYIDSYQPFPPRTAYKSSGFYEDLMLLHSGWNKVLSPAMQIDVPDPRFSNMARYSLIEEMSTRIGDYPKYGVLDRNYGGSEHDGFPDTFTVDTTAMLEWGLIDQAGRYINNYFERFVKDDGSILYRGPETGQYGRMLTVAAQYFNYGGDPALLLKLKRRIDGVSTLLLTLRDRAKRLPSSSPAYGLIAGWSEADASLEPHPERYIQPYFSNSTEAARGFQETGRVWKAIGKQKNNAELIRWGAKLEHESSELKSDIQNSISRSILKDGDQSALPAIAGASEPFHIAVQKDTSNPQYRSYRAFMEMLYSGILSDAQVKMIVGYRSRHHDIILGMPTAYGYNTGELAGFLSYGHGFALIQHDMIRQALLLTYTDMAHQYTRGNWTAPETRSILPDKSAAPYCTPAQLVEPLMAKWLLVFEDPQTDSLWLAKGSPRDWLADGQSISVRNAPSRWGKVSYSIHSHIADGKIVARVTLPPKQAVQTKLRFRVPGEPPLKSIMIDGRPWKNFDAESETITLPAVPGHELSIIANF
ncbi:MAG TPA: hypothetical protein VF126_13925 [Acidobacteriaceae bacterium]